MIESKELQILFTLAVELIDIIGSVFLSVSLARFLSLAGLMAVFSASATYIYDYMYIPRCVEIHIYRYIYIYIHSYR